MRRLLLPLLLPASLCAQPLDPILVTDLPTALNEASGTLVVGDAVWVLLDSFNPNALYKVDTATGAVLRTVTIVNAANTDWEDLTTDGEWVFVGDMGNNAGSRTDLRVYRFPLAQLQDEDVTEITAETIAYAYADQSDFTPAVDATNWDCEAMVALDDSLFLFTKNWLDERTHLYVLPAEPGEHLAQRRDTLDTQGLVTGAALDLTTSAIALIGHGLDGQPFVWQLSNFPDHKLFDGTALRRDLQLNAAQTEGIAWATGDTVYISNELTPGGPARLWKLHLDLDAEVTEEHPRTVAHFHPNPAREALTIEGPHQRSLLRILDMDGREVRRAMVADGDRVALGGLRTGNYTLELHLAGRIDRQPLLIVE